MATALSGLMEVEAALDKNLSDLKKMDDYDAASAERVDIRLVLIRTRIDTLLGTKSL
jgi:hypothetical protein